MAAAFAISRFLREDPSPPGVLIITIDTLRPDHVGPGTPALSAFLGEATRFAGARTVAPLTLPAHASLFSGLSPARHRVHDNLGCVVPSPESRDWPMLAEQFREQEYATAAFVSRVVLGRRTGMAAGFDVYECPAEGQHPDTGGYMPAEQRVTAPLAWLRDRKGSYVCWVHLFDPHAPYRAFPGDARRPPAGADASAAVRYAGEARRADAAVEKLLAAVPADTIVVIATDHGEGLGEHGEPWHGALCYGSTIDALIAVRAPGFAAGAVDKAVRSVCDVAPTLRELCGLPAVADDGVSLAGPPPAVVVSESLMAWQIHGWGQCFSASDGRYTLIEYGPRLQLFDRANDPGERRPIAPEGHPAFEALDRALLEYRSRQSAETVGLELTMEIPPYGQLRRTGAADYVARARNLELRDPEPLLAVWARLKEAHDRLGWARQQRNEHAVRQALARMDEIAREMPDSPLLQHFRAKAYAALGEITKQREWYRRSAQSELAALRGGYLRTETFELAVHACMRAGDSETLRSVLDVAKSGGYTPDARGARALAEATRALGIG